MTARLPVTNDEARRLEALHALMVVDSEPEALFDSLARAAAQACGAPMALVSLVDAERQWFKARVGVPDLRETPRDIAVCDVAIRNDVILEIPDLTLDERFRDNPMVCAPDGIRYAGAPLVLDGGERVGTLCVMDRRPRRLSEGELAALASLAEVVTQALQMRRDLIERTLAARSNYEKALARSEAIHRALVEGQTDMISLSRRSGELLYVNPAYARHFGRDPQALIGSDLFEGADAEHLEQVQAHIDLVFETGVSQHRDFKTVSANGETRWVSWVDSLQHDKDGQPLLHAVGRDVTERKRLEEALAGRERFIREITDTLPMQVAYLDTEGRYRFANLPHCRRIGVHRSDMLGRTRGELAGLADSAAIEPCLASALAGKSQRFRFETDNGDGVRVLMETRLIPDFDDEGVVRGVFETGLDITALSTSVAADVKMA